jgi:hypothetical protein
VAGGLPHYMELNEPVRQTRHLAGPPVYEPAPLAARERGFDNSVRQASWFRSSEESESLLDQIGGSLAGIAGTVEFHGTIAFIVAVLQNAEGLCHIYMN